MILSLTCAMTGFSQFGISPSGIEYHTKTTSYLDSIGIIAVIDTDPNSPTFGEFGHFIFKDQDNQIIQQFEFENNQLKLQLEGDEIKVLNLSSLSDRLKLNGTNLCIEGTSNCISTLSWLADNDHQGVDSITFDTTGILTFYLENADPFAVNIDQQELDPVFGAHIVKTITPQDITSWRDHIIQDQDLSSTNELQSLIPHQPNANILELLGSIVGGDTISFEVRVDGSYILGQPGGGGTLQFISFDTTSQLLTLSDANTVNLSSLKQNDDEEICETRTVSSNAIISPVLLHSDPDKREIKLNGWTAFEVSSPSHVQHISITNQTITFYETLDNYSVRICSKQ